MELAIQILHVLVAVFLVLVILLQAGKGAGIGAAFGGAGSSTVFGGRGAQTFLGRMTATAAAIFFLTSLTLSYVSSTHGRSVVAGEHAAPIAAEVEPAPAADAPAIPAADPAPAVDEAAAPAEAPAAP